MPGGAGGEVCILAVDDRPANLLALERALADIPVRIVKATSGEEALVASLRHRFALAILDVQMPGMDGYELAEILLGDPATSATPIIFMTAAYSDENHVFKGYIAGAVDYIVKPYHPALLVAKVKVFLELAVHRQNLEGIVADRTSELQATQGRFDVLFELAPQALLMVDRSGRVAHGNRAASQLFGLPATVLEGSEIAAILPGFEPAATDGRAAGPPSGESAPVTLLTVHRADGTAIRVEVRVATVQLDSETCALASVTDVSERIAALEDAQRSLREKEVLLKEIHHRVKNNLQIVSSLLRLKCDHLDAPEVRAPLEDSISRVRSMAMVHEHLYGNASLEQIDLGDYARHLTGILRSAYAPSAGLEVLAEPILVSIELATPIGLILNELVSNAFKHGVARAAVRAAAGEFQREDVRVEVRVEAARICIVVHDAGPGMPPGQDERSTGTLGLQLVGVLCQQLEGSIHFHNDEGLRAQFSCPFPGSG